MIADPTATIGRLKSKAKERNDPYATNLAHALEAAWRDYRWTVLPVRPDGDLSSTRWRDAFAEENTREDRSERYYLLPGDRVTTVPLAWYPSDVVPYAVGAGALIDTGVLSYNERFIASVTGEPPAVLVCTAKPSGSAVEFAKFLDDFRGAEYSFAPDVVGSYSFGGTAATVNVIAVGEGRPHLYNWERWEDHSARCGVKLGDLTTALQTAIDAANTYLRGVS